ncbi:MAG: universal stress protein [Maribacter sp.]|nr:universal stress protein [Maribacter sp.]
MKRIILPTDFSENAYHAIQYALELYKNETSTFYLLHTYTPSIYMAEYVLHSPGQIGLGDVYQEDSMAKLEKLKAKIAKQFKNPKHTFVLHTAFNTLVDEISKTIVNEKADIVIMGTQGATGAKEILMGTNTVHVIKKATCPVIAVPANFEYENPKEILFPTDYEIDYRTIAFNELISIAKSHLSHIEILHVLTGYELSPQQEKNKKKLARMLDKAPHFFHDVPNQEVIDAINGFQLKNRMGLLVMVQNKHTFLERLFLEPVIKKVGFHVTIPFMIIQHQ